MKQNNKKIKINGSILISLALLILLIFFVSNRLVFIINNVEKVLKDPETSTQNQKKFNITKFNELKTKMPLD
ncbi:MAG: hypothetical protein PHP14_02285 [Candidatus Pacebacteria bacterium]|nr:hypothetical protein [Candidatus Paceibacterota bacterium]MDD3808123.1 hypothetical protein [Candidatus Paceibacterota bacterium]